MTYEEAEEFFVPGTGYTRSLGIESENCTTQMNGLMELVRAHERKLRDLDDAQLVCERKAAAILEGERRQFHHEFMVMVTRVILTERPDLQLSKEDVREGVVERARQLAELAYPAPAKIVMHKRPCTEEMCRIDDLPEPFI